MDLTGKTTLVTGAARRVGRAVALALARAGMHVAVHYHTSAGEARATSQAIESLGVRALLLQADLSDPAQVETLFSTLKEGFGGLDLLVHSASPFRTSPFPSADPRPALATAHALLDAGYLAANAAAPLLAERNGALVFLLDLSAFRPWRHFSAHAAGKAGLWALTRQLALELAPAVRVNAVAPGPVLPPDGFPPQKIAREAAKTLLGRWGSPEDVAGAVLYLARADFVTGQVLVVDGGQSLR